MHCETAMGLQAPGLPRKVRSGSGAGQLCPGSPVVIFIAAGVSCDSWESGNGLRGACRRPSKGKD